MFKTKFEDKGYPPNLVQEAVTNYLDGTTFTTHRTSSITNKSHTDSIPPTQPQATRFITQFHSQDKKMEGIFRKHWGILLEDPLLNTCLPSIPKITYQKARNVKTHIAPSKLKSINKPSPSLTFLSIKGMYQCKKITMLNLQICHSSSEIIYHKRENIPPK